MVAVAAAADEEAARDAEGEPKEGDQPGRALFGSCVGV